MVVPTNSKKQTPIKCNIRFVIAILLLCVATIPLFAIKHLQLDKDNVLHLEHSEHVNNQQSLRAAVDNNIQQQSNNIKQVSCPKYLSDPSIYNPNTELTRDETKRLTITEPKFYISLHSQFYDKMRYVHIMKQGDYYERGLTTLFHDILSKYDTTTSKSKEERPLMLDIGMNIGWFTLYSRAHGHDVAAFEPNPTMFLRVCESLEYNHWDNDNTIELWNYGLGITPGKFNLTTGNNPGGSSFHEERLAKKFRKKMEVEVVTLDSIAMQQGYLQRKISLMKVDVEGFENYVFEGGKTLLYNSNIDNIIMENSIQNNTIVGGMVDMLYDAGYRVKEIRTVNGDPYHEDWWSTFNPVLEERHSVYVANSKQAVVKPLEAESDQIKFLSKATSNIWWVHKRFI